MSARAPLWIELELERSPGDEAIRASARGSRGERVAPFVLEGAPFGRLVGFTSAVRRAVAAGKALGDHALTEAQALHSALLGGPLAELHARMLEASRQGGRFTLRIHSRDPELQRVPWEAACRPESAREFLGATPELSLVRAVHSRLPFEPREVLGAVRILAIAAIGEEPRLASLHDALADPIAAGEVVWLPPIAGEAAGDRVVFEHLRRREAPHILHWFGHGGVDEAGTPRLWLAEGTGSSESSIAVETLAQELRAGVGESLRLIVLEACSGARPGAFQSAAELLAAAGAEAVVAHLWPVRVDIARELAITLYRELTGQGGASGDVARSLQACRRVLAERGAEVFSPVLYLRGEGREIFDFGRRRVVRPRAPGAAPSGDLQALHTLSSGRFSLVLGDAAGDLPGHDALREDLERALAAEREDAHSGPRGLSAAAAHYFLRSGRGKLQRLFQRIIGTQIEAAPPAYVDALVERLQPGAHTTLLWLPLLEWSLAARYPERTIYAVQPGAPGSGESRLVLVRRAGASEWVEEDDPPLHVDLDHDFVVLRLYGGYSAEPAPVLTDPVLTEDDHIQGLVDLQELFPSDWEAHFMSCLRGHPLLCVGLSIFEWRHRMLLRWLLDQRPPPRGSVVLTPARAEAEIWERGAGGLFNRGSVRALALSADGLAAILRQEAQR